MHLKLPLYDMAKAILLTLTTVQFAVVSRRKCHVRLCKHEGQSFAATLIGFMTSHMVFLLSHQPRNSLPHDSWRAIRPSHAALEARKGSRLCVQWLEVQLFQPEGRFGGPLSSDPYRRWTKYSIPSNHVDPFYPKAQC